MWIASLYLFTNYQFFLNIFIIFVIFWNFKIILLEKKKKNLLFSVPHQAHQKNR